MRSPRRAPRSSISKLPNRTPGWIHETPKSGSTRCSPAMRSGLPNTLCVAPETRTVPCCARTAAAWNTTDAAASPQRTGRIALFGDLERRFADDHRGHSDVDLDFDAILARGQGLVGFRRRNRNLAFAFWKEWNVRDGQLRKGGAAAIEQRQRAFRANSALAAVLEHRDDTQPFLRVAAEQIGQFDVDGRSTDVDVDQGCDAGAELHFTAPLL